VLARSPLSIGLCSSQSSTTCAGKILSKPAPANPNPAERSHLTAIDAAREQGSRAFRVRGTITCQAVPIDGPPRRRPAPLSPALGRQAIRDGVLNLVAAFSLIVSRPPVPGMPVQLMWGAPDKEKVKLAGKGLAFVLVRSMAVVPVFLEPRTA
jgi:hypothetical protein